MTTHAVFKVNGKVIKRSLAKCSPLDRFNFFIGVQTAFDRLKEHKKERKAEEMTVVREVKRKAKAGEYIKIVSSTFEFDKPGDIRLVHRANDGECAKVRNADIPGGTKVINDPDYEWNYWESEYVVLEDYEP